MDGVVDYRAAVESAGEMKAFYGGGAVSTSASPLIAFSEPAEDVLIDVHARVAVYDGLSAAPYVEDIGPAPADQLIELLTVRVYELAQQRGGKIPYTVIREVSENLIHAGFAEPVVSILDSGSTIRFTDQGPGIPDKQRALQPGFTTARSYMKNIIRGVGSGLPIVSDFLRASGGSLSLEDNLCGGTVVTISSLRDDANLRTHGCAGVSDVASASPLVGDRGPLLPSVPVGSTSPSPVSRGGAVVEDSLFADEAPCADSTRLTTRQKQVLALVLESGSAGPSVVSRELGVGLSTAYRDLASLEDLGLIVSDGGKRRLTEEGLSLLGGLSSTNNPSFL